MASNGHFYPIVGIQDGLGPEDQPLRQVHLRMELDKWYQSEELVHINQRALFFPALWRLSQTKPQEKLSWFQIAGIHGMPFISWDEPPQKGARTDEGYCTHNSILFCTWHRPYLLLFEQVIFNLMKEEISNFLNEERTSLEKAAQAWRLPYWDWALKKPDPQNPQKRDYNVPLVIRSTEVKIRRPLSPGLVPFPNAFYQFTMPGKIPMGDASLSNKDPLKDLAIKKIETNDGTIPFNLCTATSRHPEEKDPKRAESWKIGKQNNQGIVDDLRDYKFDPKTGSEERGNMTASLRDAFYRLFTINNFEDFGSKRKLKADLNKEPHAFDSSENLHDSVHLWCGGDGWANEEQKQSFEGHMSHVPVAAFDPIFWLHHCNVDRLFAIWQILHDDSWFDGTDPRDLDGGNFAIDESHPDTPHDDLRPFHKNSEGDYWTSQGVREVTKLGYTYPGLEKWKFAKPDGSYDRQKHIRELNKQLNIHYNSGRAAAEKSELTSNPGEAPDVPLMSLNSLQQVTKQDPMDLIGIHDYVVNVVYEKFALNGTMFTVQIYVGKVPDEIPHSYQESGSLIGEVFNFSTEPESMGHTSHGCQNCRTQQQDHAKSTGKVVLTNALITRWKNQIQHEPEGDGPRTLASMEPADVVKFLKHNLHWRVISMGAPLEFDRIPSLRVSMAVGKANHYADLSKLSEFYDYKGAYDVTQGRPAGAVPEDQLYPPGYE